MVAPGVRRCSLPAMALRAGSVVVASRNQVSSALGTEAAILHFGTGTYYGLNPVGARIWSLLQQPTTVARIRDILLAEYDVPHERLEHDLYALLNQLAVEGLIETRDGDPA